MEGFEEILNLKNEIHPKRKKGKGKGGSNSPRFDREFKQLDLMMLDNGRKKYGIMGRGDRFSILSVNESQNFILQCEGSQWCAEKKGPERIY